MLKVKKILCPTDFSESSYQALEEAVFWIGSQATELDGPGSASLTLLHVLPAAHPSPAAYVSPAAVMLQGNDLAGQESAMQQLGQVIETYVPGHLRQYVRPVVGRGSPADEISHAAESDGFDLIVMGTHGLTGWQHLVLGSVTEAVVRHARCPVLTVRTANHEGHTRTRKIATILCPTDFSDASLAALPAASDAAVYFAAELELVHVLEPLSPVLGVVSAEEFNESRCAEAAQALLEVIENHVPPELQESTALHRVVRVGRASDQIVGAAREVNADLIVIATHGQTGWRHMVFGSVAEEVVRTAPCPVMTICGPQVVAAKVDARVASVVSGTA